jgi:hypothetical protein
LGSFWVLGDWYSKNPGNPGSEKGLVTNHFLPNTQVSWFKNQNILIRLWRKILFPKASS